MREISRQDPGYHLEEQAKRLVLFDFLQGGWIEINLKQNFKPLLLLLYLCLCSGGEGIAAAPHTRRKKKKRGNICARVTQCVYTMFQSVYVNVLLFLSVSCSHLLLPRMREND